MLGVTDTTIKFGAAYTESQGEANAALGANLDAGDARRFYDALAKQINDAGGVAGRRLVPSYFDAAGYDDNATAVQAACEKWTNDAPAFVIFDGNDDLLRQCAKKAGIVSLATGASNSTARTFAEFPHYFEPGAVRLDRATGVTVEGLARTDYYGKAPVVGIVAWDHPDYRRSVEGTMVPALRRLGHTPTERQYVTVPESEAGLGDASAAVHAAILKMRSDGVTHVFIVDGPAGIFGGTGLTLLFIRSARGQNWVPRYGFSGANNAQSGMDAGLWTVDDIRGSRAVSTSNTLDDSDAGTTPNRTRIACLDLMKRNGIDYSDPNARAVALKACEYMWFVRRVLGSAFAPVTTDVFLRNANALGTSYASPYTYRTRLAPDRHDGAAAARTMKLDEAGCGCFVYTSPPYALP